MIWIQIGLKTQYRIAYSKIFNMEWKGRNLPFNESWFYLLLTMTTVSPIYVILMAWYVWLHALIWLHAKIVYFFISRKIVYLIFVQCCFYAKLFSLEFQIPAHEFHIFPSILRIKKHNYKHEYLVAYKKKKT